MKKAVLNTMFSKENNTWGTPQPLFDRLNRIFNFSLDCAASLENTKCDQFIDEHIPEWSGKGHRGLYLNPPYSPVKLCTQLVTKVLDESDKNAIPAVLLIPARTDTQLWHNQVFKRTKVFFMMGRVTFAGAQYGAPFPTAICIANASKEQLEAFLKEFEGQGKLVNTVY